MNELSFTSDVMPRRRVSALMNLDATASASYIDGALESVFAQSLAPDQLVLLIDRTLGNSQKAIVERYLSDPRIPMVDVVDTAGRNFADAMNAGLDICVGEWIMFVYPKGVNHPDRLAVQLNYAVRYHDVDVLSTWSEEFDDAGHQMIKASAIQHQAVVAALRWRNVIVHPSILVRSTALKRISGYRGTFSNLETYDLCVRLALSGARFRVIPAELVSLHVHQRGDFGGVMDVRRNVSFRLFCWRAGFLNVRQLLIITSASIAFDLVGSVMRETLYGLVRVRVRAAITPQVHFRAVPGGQLVRMVTTPDASTLVSEAVNG